MTSQAALTETVEQPKSENLGLALVMVIAGALIVGALFLAVTYQYKMLWFSSLIPGLAAFVIMCYITWCCRIHGRLFTLVLGAILGLLSYGSYQTMSYFAFRAVSVNQVRQAQGSALSDADANQQVDQILTEQTGASGFLGYIRFEMQQGMVVRTGTGPFGSANEVTGSGILIYWLYDFAMIVGGALVGAWWANNRAYCEHCHKYYGRIKNSSGDMSMQRLGWITKQDADDFVRLLNARHFEEVGTLIQAKRPKQAALEVRIERCDTCNTNPVIFSVYKARSILSSRQRLAFRVALATEQYERLTAFGTQSEYKPRMSGTVQWTLDNAVVVVFLMAIFLAYNAYQASNLH